MSQRLDLVDARRDEICAVVRRHHGRAVSVFGSVARGEDTATSDIDFLVEFEFHISDELEALLGVPVELVSSGA